MLKGAMSEIEPPQIQLRIPGSWASPDELARVLETSNSPYRIDESCFVHRSSDWKCDWGVSPHDDELAELFAHDGRLSKKEVKQVANHSVKIHLTGAGGSSPNARRMMDAGTALLNAGASGVMIDNSGVCHGKRDWLKLAADKQSGGLYWAWVSTTFDREAKQLFTTGMHCLGLRDAEIPYLGDEELTWVMLHNFLGYTYQSGQIVLDGDPVGDPDRALFHVHARADERMPATSPFRNPYGLWRLEPVADFNQRDDDDGDEEDG